MAMQGAGRGVHKLRGDRVSVHPANLRMLSGFAILWLAAPLVGGEDDGE